MNTKNTFQRQNNEVLIVDDNPSNIVLLTGILSIAGYTICTANSGELALRCVKSKLPAIILLDVRMPGMDGFEVCHHLKSEQDTCNIPVIFISALDDELSKLQGFQAGGVDYITKPFRQDEVLARVKAHVKLHNAMLELEFRKNKLAKEVEERKRTEENLHASEEKYRTTLYGIVDGVITTDNLGHIKFMNSAAEVMTGWTLMEAEGKVLEEVFVIINEQTRGKSETSVRKVLREGKSVGHDCHNILIAKNGTEILIADSSTPIRNLQDKITGVVLVFRDQTEERKSEKLLEEIDNRLRRAELASKTGNWEFHLNTMKIASSEGARKIYGITEAQFEYEIVKSIPLPEYRPMLDAALKNLIEEDKPYDIEFKIRTADTGIIKDIHSIASFDKERRIFFGIIQDITERKLAEEKIQSERKLLRTLIDNLPVTIYVKDKECRKIVANKLDLDVIGIQDETEVLGKTDLELFGADIGQRGLTDDLKVIQTGQAVINREEVFFDKKGVQRWLLTSKIPLFDQQGKSSGLVGIGRDITELKKAENQIKILTKSVEQSPATIVITDINGTIEYVNPKFTEISGYTAEEVIGENSRILKSGQTTAEVYRQLWNTIKVGNVWNGELLNRKKNGELFWEWVTIASIKDENDIITNYLAIKEDISQRKQMEVDLIQAKGKAEESDRLKSAFLANMSHELRTPLNSIIGFSELLTDDDFDDEQKSEFIQHVITNGHSLLSHISDIMDISKLESREVKIYKKPVVVRKFISGVQKQFAIQFDRTGLKLELNLPEDDDEIIIYSDGDRLTQIFNNLISNALKFTHEGSVQIGYRPQGKMLQFHVKDTGIGISAEFHNKIFERFRQVESSNTRSYGGNGLGLAITKNLVELMGGKIWIESEFGKGSTFYFTLPIEI